MQKGYFMHMSEFCECASPWVSGNDCDRCKRKIAPERLEILPTEEATKVPTGKLSTANSLKPGVDQGVQAAIRVKKYGTLWDKIGSVVNVLNSVGAGILLILLLVSGLEGKIILLGVVVIAVLWGLSYLQISIIKGLASYFQMRSADYLERKDREK
jgi:hypothetical protein